jgi:hypothetical protein
MAETLISPGVFLSENDLSQITQGPIAAGAALLGPTVIGPVNIPTLVTSYSEYKALFGAAFVSGGANFEYLTSIAALNYFEQGGDSLLVTRVASGSYEPATSNVETSTTTATASATLDLTSAVAAQYPLIINGASFTLSGSTVQDVYNRVSASILASTTANSSASFTSPNMILNSKTAGSIGNS